MRSLLGSILFAAAALHAQSDLSGKWKFHPGDDMRWAAPDYDDSAWGTIEVPKTWADAGYSNLKGYGWYRTTFQRQTGPFAISIGKVDDAWELFVNGMRIASAGKMGDQFGQDQFRRTVYPVPPEALHRPGTIVIAMRLWITPPVGGILEPIMAGPRAWLERQAEYARDKAIVGQLPVLAVNLLDIIVGLLVLALFAGDRARREYLWFSCMLLAQGILQFWLNIGQALSKDIPLLLLANAPLLASTAAIQFVCTFGSIPIRWWTRAVQVLPIVVTILVWAGADVLSRAAILGGLMSFWITWLILRHTRGFNPEQVGFGAAIILQILPEGILSLLSGMSHVGWITPGFAVGYSNAISINYHGQQFPFTYIAAVLAPLLMVVVLVRRFERTRHEEGRMRNELEAARAVQSLMVLPRSTPGFQLDAVYQPASEVGGDFFQVVPADDGSLLVIAGDVSGKGLRAALIVSSIIGAIRNESSRRPGEVLTHLNRMLLGQVDNGFVTCYAALISSDGHMAAANAGHLPPYVNGVDLDTDAGLPLGLSVAADYEETVHALAPGDRILFVSDGVVEARNAKGELFGFVRTLEVCGESAERIAQIAQAFGQEDDITVLALTRTGVRAHAA